MSSSCHLGPAVSPPSFRSTWRSRGSFETREDPRFFELVTEVRERLHAGGADGVARAGGTHVTSLAHDEHSTGPTGRRLRSWVPALAVFGSGLAAWEWVLPALGIERYLLPPFSDVMTALWNERDLLWRAGWITFKEALGGFALGCSVAFVFALVLARWRPLGSALMPYLIAANAVPIVAFAPITNAWFGTLSPWSKIVIAAVLCFFPVLVNTLRGLTSVRPESLELMRSYAAHNGDVLSAFESRIASHSSSRP